MATTLSKTQSRLGAFMTISKRNVLIATAMMVTSSVFGYVITLYNITLQDHDPERLRQEDATINLSVSEKSSDDGQAVATVNNHYQM